MPDWHDRLKGVVILSRDAFEIIPKIADEAGTAVYADPPYLRSSMSGNAEYRHTFQEDDGGLFDGDGDDHAQLAAQLNRFKTARVVVSYYDDPRLDELYPGWTKVCVAAEKKLARQNRRGVAADMAPEVLLINGESHTA